MLRKLRPAGGGRRAGGPRLRYGRGAGRKNLGRARANTNVTKGAAPAKSRLQRLHDAGVSIWLDTLSRELLESGRFEALVRDCAVTGATSNPAIFAKAITGSARYDDQLRAAVRKGGGDARELFLQLALEDIRRAAQILRPAYETSGGHDGFVSFECTPDVADRSEETVEQATDLWNRLDLPNVMIKVPATAAGVRAIEELTVRGVNVNVTLLFSVQRYEEVIEAYLTGLERRARLGEPLGGQASVASFFVSRVDAKADARFDEGSPLRGRVAVANAHTAYAARWIASRACAGTRSRAAARAPSGRCGRAPARRTPPTPTCSTSSA